MIIRIIAASQIRFSEKTLYLILNASLGDTFNALFYLCAAPPKGEYELILKKDHLNAASVLLKRFSYLPRVINVIDTQNGEFPLEIMQANPGYTLRRGFAPSPDLTGPLILWCMPDEYQTKIELSAHEIKEWKHHFATLTIPPEIEANSIIFLTSRGVNPDHFPDFPRIAAKLNLENRAKLYVNVSNIGRYGKEDIDGIEAISPTVDQLIALAYSPNHRISFVGLKSGMFDIMRFSTQQLIPFYDEDELLWSRMRLASMLTTAPSLEIQYRKGMTHGEWSAITEQIVDFLKERHG